MKKGKVIFISVIVLIISLIPAKLMSLSKKIKSEELVSNVYKSETENSNGIKIGFYGTACLTFSYKGSTYLNDPFFSNPSYFEILTGRYKDHSEVIDPYLNKMDSISLVTITHGHYDHCLDFPYFMRKYTENAKIVSSNSTLLSLNEYTENEKKWQELPIDKELKQNWIYSEDKVFRVFPVKSNHQAHIGKIKLFSGENEDPLSKAPGSVWKWKEGTTYSFIVDVLNDKKIVDRFLIVAGDLPTESIKIINELQKEKSIKIMFSPFWHKEKSGAAFEYSYNLVKPEKVVFYHWNNFFNNADHKVECIRSSDIEHQLGIKKREGYPVSIMLPFTEVTI